MTALLSLDDVAERAGVSRRTVEREIAAKRLQATWIGSRTLVTVKEYEAWLAGSRAPRGARRHAASQG